MAKSPKRRNLVKFHRKSKEALDHLVIDRAGISNDAKRLLSLGLSFVPATKHHQDLRQEIAAAAYKADRNINKRFRRAIKAPINTLKAASTPASLTKIMTTSLETLRRPSKTCNLSPAEKRGLDELLQKDDIVIKKADKGASVVVLTKDEYVKEARRQLSDTSTYKPLRIDEATALVSQTWRCTQELLLEAKAEGLLSAKQLQQALAHKTRMPNWYLLPKVHKTIRADTGTYPGRPILSGCAAPHKPIDKLLAKLLTPLLQKLERRLADTKSFLNHIGGMTDPQPPSTVLFSFDIESLYPSIPQREAIDIVVQFYAQHRDSTRTKIVNVDWVRRALELVVLSNVFQFDGQHYRQIKGTAMGTSISVALAEIYVNVTIEQHPFIREHVAWRRYIDDIFGVHIGSESALTEKFRRLNTINPALKFTMELNRERLVFLDTEVYLDCRRRLQTTIHYKASDLHQYLHTNSSHPTAMKRSLPYSQGLRIKRIVSDHTELDGQLRRLCGFFRRRGYTEKTLQAAMQKLSQVERATLLGPSKTKAIGDRDIYVFTHNQRTHRALSMGMRAMYEWASNHYNEPPFTTSNTFDPNIPMIAWKRSKNLKNLLVRAAFPAKIKAPR